MKKFIPYILILAIVGVGVLGPIGAKITHAGLFDLLDLPGKFVKSIAAWVGQMVLTIVSQLLTIVGFLFDAAVKYSISDQGEQISNVITDGWSITRDFVNLFFIFILLYIAIATILQITGYGIKDLLVKVIIIALLVNFSLMITKVIIDASNILALEFYKNLEKVAVVDDVGNPVLDANGNPKTVRLSEAIVSGINPQKIFDTKAINKTTKDAAGNPITVPQDEEGTLMQIIIISVFGSIIILVLVFVLFAAAILFVIRTAILWILMILAPLAFLAMVLPATKGYASKWWQKLFDQSFFAPAYLFMIFLVVKIITKGAIIEDVRSGNATFGTAFGSPDDVNVKLILNFVILIVLLISSLIIAKQMGAYGAGTAISWGKKLKGAAQGYAGRIGKRYVGRAATAAEGALEKERESKIGRGFAKTLKAMPFLQRGLAGVAQLKKKEVGKYEKQYEKYDATTLEQLKGKFGTTREARTAMENLIKKKRAQEAKKENVEKEKARYDAIVGTPEKNYKDGELPRAEKDMAFVAPKGYVERYAEIESGIETLRGEKTIEAENERTGLIVKREKLKEIKEKIDKLNAEKAKIEENRARRIEIEALEESVAKAKTGVEGIAAKKPKEAEPKKT